MTTEQGKVPPAGTSLIYRPPSYFERLQLAHLFAQEQALEVELGSGDGSFLAQWAALHPRRSFIGVERLLGRLRKLDRKGQRAGLANLRLLRIEAGYFMEYMLPPASVAAVHIYFPDPWPKRKHRKNRLVSGPFVDVMARTLPPGGRVFLRTDDPDYFAQMKESFGGSKEFKETETLPELRAVLTDFERGFQARGVATLAVAYERKAG